MSLKHSFTANCQWTSFGMSEGRICYISNTTSVTHLQSNLAEKNKKRERDREIYKLCHIHHSWKEWLIPRISDTTDTLTEWSNNDQSRKPSFSKHCLPLISMYIELHTIYILGSYSSIIQSVNLINMDQRNKSLKHLYLHYLSVNMNQHGA
jgi:hypothetical protein